MRALRLAFVLLLAFSEPIAAQRAPRPVRTHGNEVAAGAVADGVLDVDLVIGKGNWKPEAEDGIALTVMAFGERGRGLSVPGPLLRVPAGTEVRARIRNHVGVAVFVHGLFDRSVEPLSEAPAPVLIRPGKTSEVRFRADAPGSFSYWASTNITAEVGGDRGHDNMMQGALVIDEPGPTPPDRVFVIGIWEEAPSRTDPEAGGRETLVINGKSWPHTERMVHTVGDTIRWRWINASERGHPMHLHGYFFRVDGKGDFVASETFEPEMRRQAVTEQLEPGESMYVTWSPPDHPGNWIFHCHLSYHVNGALRLTPVADGEKASHMAGLALGIEVRPDPDDPDAYRWSTERTLQLHAETIEDQWEEMDGLAFRLAGDRVEPMEAATIPGPPLILTRGEATAVQVINHLDEATSIHWHGLELESYSDGVPDWSGTAGRIAHPVEPGDTFEAHLTLKRAGTFIYHSHLRDIHQLSRGMYGAILVLEPGEQYDPTTDHLFVLGWGGGDAPPTWELNGSSDPEGREIAVGVSQRLRFVNIAPAAPRELRLRDPDGQLVQWRRVAEDGALVGAARAHPVPAVGEVDVGETLDVSFNPDRPGTYVLEVPRWPGQPPFRVSLTAR